MPRPPSSGKIDLAVVGEAASVVQACEVIEGREPDVVLLDVHLQNEDGAWRQPGVYANATGASGVLVLSVSDEPDDLRGRIDAGGHGFIHKGADPRVLVDSVRRAAAGQRVIGQ